MTQNEELIKEIKDKLSYIAPEIINLITSEGRYKLDVEFEVNKDSSIRSITFGNPYKLTELIPFTTERKYVFNPDFLAIRDVSKHVLSGKVIHFNKKEKK